MQYTYISTQKDYSFNAEGYNVNLTMVGGGNNIEKVKNYIEDR